MGKAVQISSTGEAFPRPYTKADGLAAYFDQGALYFVITLANPTPDEISGIRRGAARYGVYVSDAIPFIILDFKTAKTSFDCYINILREEHFLARDAFLSEDPESCLLTVFLVDWKTGTLEGLRTVGADHDFIATIRSACLEQLARYSSEQEVTNHGQKVLGSFSTPDLSKKARMYKA